MLSRGRKYLFETNEHESSEKFLMNHLLCLTLLWRISLSYRNQSISKSVDWLLYDRDLRNERFKIDSERSSRRS